MRKEWLVTFHTHLTLVDPRASNTPTTCFHAAMKLDAVPNWMFCFAIGSWENDTITVLPLSASAQRRRFASWAPDATWLQATVDSMLTSLATRAGPESLP